jgi:hypothetical protein
MFVVSFCLPYTHSCVVSAHITKVCLRALADSTYPFAHRTAAIDGSFVEYISCTYQPAPTDLTITAFVICLLSLGRKREASKRCCSNTGVCSVVLRETLKHRPGQRVTRVLERSGLAVWSQERTPRDHYG